MKYLYGGSVKKIQSYIFGASRLKEIAGASELVDYVCTDLFREFAESHGAKDLKIVIGAAGNIRALSGDRELIEKIMLRFPKEVEEAVPGIQFIQAVEEITGEKISKSDTNRLEQQLRMKLPSVTPYKDWSVTVKSPRSGKPAVRLSHEKENELQDIETVRKLEAVNQHWKKLKQEFGVSDFLSDTDKLAGVDNYIAVIHADGNSLGQTLMKLSESENYEGAWQDFSQKLDESTKNAAKRAFQEVFTETVKKFRPIILGGDDLTVVCAGEKALPFLTKYLAYFEEETEKHPILGHLTACAGVAFIKKSFPFYYGADLAEMLCGETKKAAKELKKQKQLDYVPSSLMFAAESGGFIDKSFKEMEQRSLTAGDISFVFGPYGIDGTDGMPSVDTLLKASDCLKEHTSLKNGLRKLKKTLYESEEASRFAADRIEQIAKEKEGKAFSDLKVLLQELTGKAGQTADSLYDLLICNNRTPLHELLLISDLTNTDKEDKNA